MKPGQSLLVIFELVYPPISNQEAHWLRENRFAEQAMRQSDFYMMGTRPEAIFENLDPGTVEENILRFDLRIGSDYRERVTIRISELESVIARGVDEFEVDFGPKVVMIWDSRSPSREEEDLIDWFTTERLLWARQHGYEGVSGTGDVTAALTYELLYVGIAKRGDSFDRLIRRAHHARQDILSNETPRSAGSRVTDEIVIFLFAASNTFEIDTLALTSDGFAGSVDRASWSNKAVIADAEKAFVSTLRPSYNREQFRKYPSGRDGLYQSGLLAYGYMLGEAITFTTATETFRGGRDPGSDLPPSRADAIFVSGDSVKLVRNEDL